MIDQAKDESEKEPMHEVLDELMSVEIEELNPSLLGATDEREMSMASENHSSNDSVLVTLTRKV